jgi:hypothetical protein
MAIFNKSDEISEELLKKSMDASKNAQEIVIDNSEEVSATDKHSLAYLKANGIDGESSIDILGDKEMFETRLRDFVSLAKSKYGSLMDCKANMNMDKYSEESAILKKEANYLGIKELFIMAKAHEQKAKAGDTNYVIENFKTYEDEIMRIIRTVEEYIN